jgi:hypothetical protein
MLIVLRKFLFDDRAILFYYSHSGIREYFYALQPKMLINNINDNNNNNNNNSNNTNIKIYLNI